MASRAVVGALPPVAALDLGGCSGVGVDVGFVSDSSTRWNLRFFVSSAYDILYSSRWATDV